MKRNFTLIMTIAVLGGFAVILSINLASLLGFVPSKYISPNDVRGMAVEHHGVLFTLNFDQQNRVVDIFNRAVPISRASANSRKVVTAGEPTIKKIIVYRFGNAHDIEISPVSYVGQTHTPEEHPANEPTSLVFSATDWNPNGLLEEPMPGQLNEILLNTYDP